MVWKEECEQRGTVMQICKMCPEPGAIPMEIYPLQVEVWSDYGGGTLLIFLSIMLKQIF